jgi:large subunit ribosomal protein L21
MLMHAILKHGGHQYRVSAGDRLLVDRIPAEVGSTVTLEPVLLLSDGEADDAGAVSEASVTATVVAHRRGRKIRVFTFKPKKRRRRTLGYRSQLTELRVEEVLRTAAKPGRATAKRSPAAPAAVAEPAVVEVAPELLAEHPAPAEKPARPAAKRATAPAARVKADAPATKPTRKKAPKDGS